MFQSCNHPVLLSASDMYPLNQFFCLNIPQHVIAHLESNIVKYIKHR